MSIHILANTLNQEQLSIIAKLLSIEPKKKYFANKYQYYKNKRDDEQKDVVKMYELIQKNNQYIFKLPYQFARKLFNMKIPDYHIKINYNFTQELYIAQQQVAVDAINNLQKHGTVVLNLYTSFGKTVMGAYLGAWSRRITLVIYTNTVLQPQWHKTFRDFTNANIWVVGETEPHQGGTHVILSMNTRIHKIPDFFLKQVGTVIYDEVDTFCTKGRLNCWLDITPKYVIAASATLRRPDGMEQMITAACGDNIIRKISTKPFVVYKYLTGIEIELKKDKTGRHTDWNKYQEDMVTNADRNRQILQLVHNNPDSKILIITSRKDKHAIPLYEWFKSLGISVDYMAGNKKSYDGNCKVLFGTFHKLGRGFDEKAACESFNGIRINLLILVCSFAEDVPLEQIAGRVFRSKFPRIIYFKDISNIADNHWRVAKKWFESRNGIIQTIESLYYINNIKGKDIQAEKQTSMAKTIIYRHKNMKMI